MSIKRCFFWKQGQKLACVWYKGSEPVLLKPKGQVFATESADYWRNWEDYIGFLPDQEDIDFCLVYEEELHLPKKLEERMAVPKYNFWNQDRLKECLKLLGVDGYVEFVSPEGKAVMQLRMTRSGQASKKILRIRPMQSEPEKNEDQDRELKAFTAYYLDQADKKHKSNT